MKSVHVNKRISNTLDRYDIVEMHTCLGVYK